MFVGGSCLLTFVCGFIWWDVAMDQKKQPCKKKKQKTKNKTCSSHYTEQQIFLSINGKIMLAYLDRKGTKVISMMGRLKANFNPWMDGIL